MQYTVLCVFCLPISLTMIVRTCVLYLIIIINSDVWPICHCLGLGHETMLCAVCPYILTHHLCFHTKSCINVLHNAHINLTKDRCKRQFSLGICVRKYSYMFKFRLSITSVRASHWDTILRNFSARRISWGYPNLSRPQTTSRYYLVFGFMVGSVAKHGVYI